MDRICFKVNGVSYSVGPEISSDVMLLDYIRDYLHLKGTKYMCRQGGCGACTVAAVRSPGAPCTSVNSCLVSITSCKDWDITTIEKVGNRLDGYNVIQTTLADNDGSQCGYCSPGWVMSMYSLLKSKKNLTMLEIEKSLSGNICRCTGYRPILEAFKKFASDAPKAEKILDIEDLHICKESGRNCKRDSCEGSGWCVLDPDDVKSTITEIRLKDGRIWFRVNYLTEILNTLSSLSGITTYMLVNGNTAKGVYPILVYPDVLIDISGVKELKGFYLDQNIVVGAGNTLNEFMIILKNCSKKVYFEYFQKLYDHLELVAHVSVRNIGSIAGNLMIKKLHPEFQSDVFLLLETVGAEVTIVDLKGTKRSVPMQAFLKENMRGKVLVNVLLPPLNESYKLVTYKVSKIAQNAHAIVNAGFLYKLEGSKVVLSRIVFGGLSPHFNRAVSTELFLKGRVLFHNETLQGAIAVLAKDLVVTENPPEPSAKYRLKLAIGLFYKGLLSLCPEGIIHVRYRSAPVVLKIKRPVSHGQQSYITKPELYPLNEPVTKVEALIQCAGEAMYSDDLPCIQNEVFAEEVLATVPTGTIVSIDASAALKQEGVLAFYSSQDIPGLNSFIPKDQPINAADEEIFSIGTVKYYNQPIGVVVATTAHLAKIAAKLVQVKYSNIKPPVLDIKEAKKHPDRVSLQNDKPATNPGTNVVQVIKGSNTVYGQYHFSLETLVSIGTPTEEGLEIHPTTHWMNGVQVTTSRALLMDENRIDVIVRRLGGSFGIKITRSLQVAAVCALVMKKLNRPCRVVLSLCTVMKAFGKRLPGYDDFEVGIDSSGRIQYLNQYFYSDSGWKVTEKIITLADKSYNNCYDVTKWNYKSFNVLTDTAKNTWCRSPATLETIAMAELIIEKIATLTSRDPLQVRLMNIDDKKYGELRKMVNTIKLKADYDVRKLKVEKYNQENRWKKRGIRFSFLRWTPDAAQTLEVNLSVFSEDGTISIIHGGIEMGQGINTKAVQVAAYLLGVPMNKIQIKANNTNFTPNNFQTGGSTTSQNVTTGVERCCVQLLKRLAPLRKELGYPSWEVLVKEAYRKNIDLQSHGFVGFNDTQDYNIYGVAVAEVEIDVLTGESEVLRVDLLQDVGQSVSPRIDIGQVEGAFIMGLGYWTCEHLVYDRSSGELLTDSTWTYKVPQARDIPQDFRIYLRENSFSDVKFFGAKACGEPPMCLSVVIPIAMRQAITSARMESGIPSTNWFDIHGPYTLEAICLATETNFKDFKFN